MANVLVLDSTYEPMNVATRQRAVELAFAGKAEAVHNREKQLRSAGGFAIPLPSRATARSGLDIWSIIAFAS